MFYADGITWKLTQNILRIVQPVAEIMGTHITSCFRVHFPHSLKKGVIIKKQVKATKRACGLGVVKLSNFRRGISVLFSVINEIYINLVSNTTLLYTIYLIDP